MLGAIQKELLQRRNDLQGEALRTLYIGGGTPSVLSPEQTGALLRTVHENYTLVSDAEITLEANPDDLSPDYLASIKDTGINRLSIGVQSFHDDDLVFMNRTHTGEQAEKCLENAARAGFDNINADLIYGFPGLTGEKWEENLHILSRHLPGHISAYHLSYESGTVFDYGKRKNRFSVISDNESLDQYKTLTGRLEQYGYRHYEISNFARPGFISRHNSAYWNGQKYIGIGPSAHSFDGKTRRWNHARNASYIKALSSGSVYFECETPDEKARYHEYLITHLRTCWGVNTVHIRELWGEEYYDHFFRQAGPFIAGGKLVSEGDTVKLSEEGMFIADHIVTGLFMQT